MCFIYTPLLLFCPFEPFDCFTNTWYVNIFLLSVFFSARNTCRHVHRHKGECVSCVCCGAADHFIGPCLWVGTGLGSVIVINLDIPCLAGDQRANQPVIVSPSGAWLMLCRSVFNPALTPSFLCTCVQPGCNFVSMHAIRPA